MEGSDGGASAAAPPAPERFSLEATPPASPHLISYAPPSAMPLPAWGAERRRWRRNAARCAVVCPLATGSALLMGCFLLCPILWLRMPPGALAVSRAVLLGGAVVSVWAFVAGAVFCLQRARRRARRRPAAPRRPPSPPWARSRPGPRPRPRSRSLDSAAVQSPPPSSTRDACG